MVAAEAPRTQRVRTFLGLLISLAFVVLTGSRVDLPEVGRALLAIDGRGIALAIGVVLVELVLRAARWQRLLEPIASVPLRLASAYLAIGYFANSLLPARLGDLARAVLAARSFNVGRLPLLGTILVERLADGIFIVLVVAGLGLVLAGGESLAANAIWIGGLGVVGLLGVGVLIAFLRTGRTGPRHIAVRSLLDRTLEGAAAIRSLAGLSQVAGLTVAAFMMAVVSFSLVAQSAGLELTLAESALAMGGLALSTSIPAAPGSIGTYEFVGLAILTALGVPAEAALAVVVIVHLVATLPLALTGLVMTWRFHFRVADVADAEPAVASLER